MFSLGPNLWDLWEGERGHRFKDMDSLIVGRFLSCNVCVCMCTIHVPQHLSHYGGFLHKYSSKFRFVISLYVSKNLQCNQMQLSPSTFAEFGDWASHQVSHPQVEAHAQLLHGHPKVKAHAWLLPQARAAYFRNILFHRLYLPQD